MTRAPHPPTLRFGIGMGCGRPIIIMMTFSNAAEGRSGEALGLRITVNHLARMIGTVVFGMIGTAFGVFPCSGSTR